MSDLVVQGDAYALSFACDPVITQKQKFLVISRADFAAGKRLIFELKCIIERTVVLVYYSEERGNTEEQREGR